MNFVLFLLNAFYQLTNINRQVAEVIAAIKEVDLQEVVDNAYANSTRIFFPSDL